ncbi:DoxX family protein [Micromonospora sp. WMMD882]|uniref:DoxX family protein n=1 Tax=Micromonospora sp. WMMD882 TaxID=3015151 RepID=UPI00248D2E08|nr:DoxX family protein [Micromonospora sp. WMMD882]WBB78358.1 DoxX family protein [Micromonospora sp. WMMD882]
MSPLRSLARVLLSGVFVTGGLRQFRDPGRYVEQSKPVTDRITPLLEQTAPTLPSDAETLIRANGAAQVVGGLLLATGHATRPVSLLLAGSLVPTTLAGHPFWAQDDPAARAGHQVHFLKNLGLIGGLLLAAADTGGRPSLRWRAGHRIGHSRRSVRRAVRTARRETRLAVRTATAARRLPG